MHTKGWTIRILLPVPRKRRRGIEATTGGTTLKIRVNEREHNSINTAAAKIGVSAAQFMQQVVVNAADEVRKGVYDDVPGDEH